METKNTEMKTSDEHLVEVLNNLIYQSFLF